MESHEEDRPWLWSQPQEMSLGDNALIKLKSKKPPVLCPKQELSELGFLSSVDSIPY